MSYNRKQRDAKKVNNYVAKNDFNQGGFHGKSKKAKRRSENVEFSLITISALHDFNKEQSKIDHEVEREEEQRQENMFDNMSDEYYYDF